MIVQASARVVARQGLHPNPVRTLSAKTALAVSRMAFLAVETGYTGLTGFVYAWECQRECQLHARTRTRIRGAEQPCIPCIPCLAGYPHRRADRTNLIGEAANA